MSLNDALYQGPDLNNHLQGVLLRFREGPVAFASDIQDMFCHFKVPVYQRDLLRFFWFQNNKPGEQIVQYRSARHIFGCTCSPAVAIFALKSCASSLDGQVEVKSYIEKRFYVDDGLFSTSSSASAIEILTSTKEILGKNKMRLHKIISTDQSVIDHFPSSECATTSTELPFEQTQYRRALGVSWDTTVDCFKFAADLPCKPFTKRGILSIINTLYDPLGLVSPVILTGRLFKREILPSKNNSDCDVESCGWDGELPLIYKARWNQWVNSLDQLLKVNCSLWFLEHLLQTSPSGAAHLLQCFR